MQRPAQTDAGFSLIETLVVVFIIGLVASMAVLALPQRTGPARADAEALRMAFETAQDAAFTTGLIYAVEVGEKGWQTVRMQSGEWQQTVGKGGQYATPGDGVSLLVSRPGRDTRKTKETGPVRVWFDPVGQALPVSVTLRARGESATVRVGRDGTITLGDEADR